MSTSSQTSSDSTFDLLLGNVSVKDDDENMFCRATGRYDLTQLETHANALVLASEVLQKRMQARIAATLRQRNSLLPIHRLPTELLITIFTLILRSAPCRAYYKRLWELSTVSSLWHSLLTATPSLWALVSSSYSPTFIERILSNSRNSLLRISSMETYWDHSGFMEKLSPHVYRWQSAFLVCTTMDSIGKFLSAPAPKLEALSITLMDSKCTKALDLFRGEADRLQDLHLSGCPITWSPDMLSGLRTLKLHAIKNLGPALSDMLTILSRSSGLRELSLDSIAFSDERLSGRPASIPLASLKKLHLVNISPIAACTLITRLKIPRCNLMTLRFSFDYQSARAVLGEDLSHLSPPLRNSISSSTSLYARISQTSIQFRTKATPSDRGFNIDIFDLPAPFDMFTLLLKCLPPYSIRCPVEVELGSFIDLNEVSTWVSTFALLERLNVVTVLRVEVDDDVGPLLRWLGQPKTNKAGLRWRLPHLQELHLGANAFNAEDVLDMVESRYGKLHGLPPATKGLPARFTALSFYGEKWMDEWTYEQVGEIVGMDNVQWDNGCTSYDEESSSDASSVSGDAQDEGRDLDSGLSFF